MRKRTAQTTIGKRLAKRRRGHTTNSTSNSLFAAGSSQRKRDKARKLAVYQHDRALQSRKYTK